MGKPEPSMDQWLAEAKASENADQCGMFLVHNGIVRSTAKAQVREGQEMPNVAQVDFSYDAEGVESAIAEALTWDGVYSNSGTPHFSAAQRITPRPWATAIPVV